MPATAALVRFLSSRPMIYDALYEDPDLASFYDADNDWSTSFDYCLTLAEGCTSVLDLGCGTGVLSAAIAQAGCGAVWGVDPAVAMLEIARARPGGDRVNWVAADGRNVRVGRRFDLVVMTGHAFQVFLTQADRLAVLQTVAAHLAPHGRFIFDSRNPAVEEWREWVPAESGREVDHPELGPAQAWNDVARDPETGIVTYETCYRVAADGRLLRSRSRIAFPSREEIDELLKLAGLTVDAWLGDWSGGPCNPDSPEMIPIGRLKAGDGAVEHAGCESGGKQG
ncbi:class I SAM-dependent methyltransferase [Burkholderia stagnalis]|uniref:class I SAM-dependent methyltransferase n=1 Tax=Burkholderia stagnalis TaxID=1503054 RepID=UPI001E419E6A|nr:class I SAM-dependent methyltransferase [Burkholderia stagnalis]